MGDFPLHGCGCIETNNVNNIEKLKLHLLVLCFGTFQLFVQVISSEIKWIHDVIAWIHFPRYWPFVWEIHRSDERKHQSFASLAFVRGIHRWPVNSPHQGPVNRKMFPFDDVIMSNNGLAPNNRQVITETNDDSIQRRMYVELGGN